MESSLSMRLLSLLKLQAEQFKKGKWCELGLKDEPEGVSESPSLPTSSFLKRGFKWDPRLNLLTAEKAH